MTKHALLPPSSAARRMACPGSLKMESRVDKKEEKSALEGQLAHELASCLLQNNNQDIINKIESECEINGFDFNEMKYCVNKYVSMLSPYLSSAYLKGIEALVPIDVINPRCFGTTDAWFVFEKNKEYSVAVYDFKYGHSYVEVIENYQLLEYSAGIVHCMKKANIHINFITLHIFQPRCFQDVPHRYWKISLEQLDSYVEQLKKSEALALTENAPLRPSSQCKYCSARFTCPALREVCLEEISTQVNEYNHNVNPSHFELETELRLLRNSKELLDVRIDALEEQIVHLLKQGKRFNRFRLEEGRSYQKWKIELEGIKQIGELFGVNLIKEEPITPKQAIKLGILEKFINNYSEILPGTMQLKEVTQKSIKKIFNK